MPKSPHSLSQAERLDVAFALWIAGLRKNPVVKLLSAAAQISDQPPMLGSAAAALAAGLVLDDRRLAEAGLRVLAAGFAATMLKSLVERSMQRTRPNAVLDGKPYRRRRGRPQEGAFKSFPSGHTADAVAAARALGRVYPEHSALIWTVAAVIAGVQLPSGAHYPSDIVAGALVGLAGGAAADVLVSTLLQGLERGGAGLADGLLTPS